VTIQNVSLFVCAHKVRTAQDNTRNPINMTTTQQQSLLVIGASSRTGLECIRHFAKHQTKPAIHAFCRDAGKLADKDKALCTTIVQGDVCNPIDLERALTETQANIVILSIRNGDSVKNSDIRTDSARALVRALKKPQYKRVRTVVVHGNSRMGKLISFHLFTPCSAGPRRSSVPYPQQTQTTR
jgi:FlaA1/EpsC-like NDP-sugar epimerase